MPLILAVEPDPRKFEHVAAIARGRPRTELIVAESIAAALGALAARVPDVLLVSPALSEVDRDRLTACLRDLGPAAAHVRTLTTPAPPPEVPRPVASTPHAPSIDQRAPGAAGAPPAEPSTDKGVQDEWGFFDPSQCGFSALTKATPPAPDQPNSAETARTSVRVISY